MQATKKVKNKLFVIVPLLIASAIALLIMPAPASAAQEDLQVGSSPDLEISAQAVLPSDYTVDARGTTTSVPWDVIDAMSEVKDSPLSASRSSFDFNLDGKADFSVTMKSDGTALLTRLSGAILLTKDYVYRFDFGVYLSITFKVYQPVQGISLNKGTLSMTPGSTSSLSVKFNPGNATNKNVSWHSSNSSVATVDKNGKVKAKKAGRATITATSADGNRKASCRVTVKKEKTQLNAPTKSFKAKTKVKNYTCALKDSKGKAVKNVKLTLKVNGKTYKAKTNSKGKATFKIKKHSKKKTYKATVKYAGNKVYKAASKKARITVR